VYLSARSSIG